MSKEFVRGVHPPSLKDFTKSKCIEDGKAPLKVKIPMHANPRFAADVIVAKGDIVSIGQKIADTTSPTGLPVHSPISGKVTWIDNVKLASGAVVKCVDIESDGLSTLDSSIKPKSDNISLEDFIKVLREGGISGMGGAEFPTYCKFVIPKEFVLDTLLLNGGECEPYLTSDHRVMLERAHDIVRGAKIVLKCASIKRCMIGIEDNKPDAINAMTKACEDDSRFEVVSVKSNYPQGSEKHLIFSVTGRTVPMRMLPLNIGVTVMNVSTAAAIADLFDKGMPLIERVVTITGSAIANPSNLRLKIGTLVKDIVEECGGFIDEPAKVIMGGPMMGFSMSSLDVPIGKGSSGIVAMLEGDLDLRKPANCIRCGKCVQSCPMMLEPAILHQLCDSNLLEKAAKYNVVDCIECGVCSYVCPSKRNIVQSIKTAKYRIAQERARKAGSDKK